MHIAILRPSSESLALVVEQNAKQTPQKRERPVRHNRRDIPILDDPLSDELAESITPDVFVDRNCNEQTSRDWLVAVDCIRRHNTGQSSDLDTSAGVANDDNDLPTPLSLVTDTDDDVAQIHNDDVWYHCDETHFRLTNALVSLGCTCRNPVGEWSSSGESDHCTCKNSEIGKANALAAPVVWWGGKGLSLREIESQEAGTAPADDEGGKFHDGESKQLPGDPEIKEDALDGCWVWSVKTPLRFTWVATTEEWISLCGLDGGEIRRP